MLYKKFVVKIVVVAAVVVVKIVVVAAVVVVKIVVAVAAVVVAGVKLLRNFHSCVKVFILNTRFENGSIFFLFLKMSITASFSFIFGLLLTNINYNF